MARPPALSGGLLEAFAITPRALVALVGAGGKTTLMWSLVAEARTLGWTALGGTTTKVGAWQVPDGEPFLFTQREGDKLVGQRPQEIDEVFSQNGVDLVVVEADGAHGKVVKAPAQHEPSIPSSATLVIAVIGADAIDRVIEDVAHRPMLAAALCGCGPYERLTIPRAVALLTSPRGSAKDVPDGSRFTVAITRIGDRQQANARHLAEALGERGVGAVPIPWAGPRYSPPP